MEHFEFCTLLMIQSRHHLSSPVDFRAKCNSKTKKEKHSEMIWKSRITKYRKHRQISIKYPCARFQIEPKKYLHSFLNGFVSHSKTLAKPYKWMECRNFFLTIWKRMEVPLISVGIFRLISIGTWWHVYESKSKNYD